MLQAIAIAPCFQYYYLICNLVSRAISLNKYNHIIPCFKISVEVHVYRIKSTILNWVYKGLQKIPQPLLFHFPTFPCHIPHVTIIEPLTVRQVEYNLLHLQAFIHAFSPTRNYLPSFSLYLSRGKFYLYLKAQFKYYFFCQSSTTSSLGRHTPHAYMYQNTCPVMIRLGISLPFQI